MNDNLCFFEHLQRTRNRRMGFFSNIVKDPESFVSFFSARREIYAPQEGAAALAATKVCSVLCKKHAGTSRRSGKHRAARWLPTHGLKKKQHFIT